MLSEYGLAMDLNDLKFLQSYFRDEEKRDPTITELRLVDTYWSDHCRHTTFGTPSTPWTSRTRRSGRPMRPIWLAGRRSTDRRRRPSGPRP